MSTPAWPGRTSTFDPGEVERLANQQHAANHSTPAPSTIASLKPGIGTLRATFAKAGTIEIPAVPSN